MATRISASADKAAAVCTRFGWERDWSKGGCYLHLEVSEFIEALRGKGDTTPLEEAADVLFVLLSMCKGHDIDPDAVVEQLHRRCDELLVSPDPSIRE